MTSQEAVYARFPALRRHMMQLEADIQNFSQATDASSRIPIPQDEFNRALYQLGNLQAELREMRELLVFWETHNRGDPIPIATHVLFALAAIYLAVMLGVVLYLVAVARS